MDHGGSAFSRPPSKEVLGSVWTISGTGSDGMETHVCHVMTVFVQYSPRIVMFLLLHQDPDLASDTDVEGNINFRYTTIRVDPLQTLILGTQRCKIQESSRAKFN